MKNYLVNNFKILGLTFVLVQFAAHWGWAGDWDIY